MILKLIQRFSKMKGDFNFKEFEFHPKTTKVQSPLNEVEVKVVKTKSPKQKCVGINPSLTLKTILDWRKLNSAPVDVVGCQRLFEREVAEDIQKYQILISLVLSVQTKDETTSKCIYRLQKQGLTPSNLSQMSEQNLIKLIYQCNFNRRKAKNIIAISKMILSEGIASTKEKLMQYPGVGVKIAMIYLKVAEGKVEGIGVDTHVHRIANRLGWINTQTPNQSQLELQKLFPKEEWADVNIGLVGFGQTLCEAKNPRCSSCPVYKNCPSSSIQF